MNASTLRIQRILSCPISTTVIPRGSSRTLRGATRVRPQRIISRLLILLILAVATLWAGAASAQTTYQAENGSLAGGTFVAWSRAGYTDSGHVDGFTSSSSKVTLNVSLPAGLYELTIRYGTPYGEKGYDLTINGTTSSLMFSAASDWATTSAGKVLLDTTNTISIGGGWGWYLIDSITLTPTTVAPPSKPASTTPVDPLATQQAKNLFTFLRNQYGDKTISGQQEINDVNNIISRTGRRPGVLSQDLIEYSPTRVQHGASPAVPTEQIISLVQQYGHLCSITWHWNAPMHLIDSAEQPWWRGFYTEATTYDLAYALANPSSPEYQALIRDLDAIAVQLIKLQNANIPVLWRPLHEAEGGWFWWGAKGPGPFVELWRLMYNRYTQVHGLHNLIWVFTAQSANLAWYPGDAYVDMVGADRYPTDVYDPLSGIFEELQTVWAGNKMLALSEFGGMADIGKNAPVRRLLGLGSLVERLYVRLYVHRADAALQRPSPAERTDYARCHAARRQLPQHQLRRRPALDGPPGGRHLLRSSEPVR